MNLLNKYAIGPDDTQVGFILYGNSSSLVSKLNQLKSSKAVVDVLSSGLTNPADGTNIQSALQLAMTQLLFDTDNGARVKAAKTVLIFVNDKSPNKDLDLLKASQLRRSGVNIVIVAMGNRVDSASLENLVNRVSNVHVDLNVDSIVGKLVRCEYELLMLIDIFGDVTLKVFSE